MNEEEKCESTNVLSVTNVGKQAGEILKALSHFDYPENASDVSSWLEKIQPLQLAVRKLCESDRSGRTTIHCVNVLYDMIATNGDFVSPAVWNLLELVDESKVASLVKDFSKDSPLRLKNALCALVRATCRFGHRVVQLETWCKAFIKCLEEGPKYFILLCVFQVAMPTLICNLIFPHSRKLSFSLVERILYIMGHPDVFDTIVDQLPEVLTVLGNDEHEETKMIYERFCKFIKTLMDRFSTETSKYEGFGKIRRILERNPANVYEPAVDIPIWSSVINQKSNSKSAELAAILECPVCYERFVTPILICENGHSICKNCKNQLKTCPICRAQFSSIRMTLVEQIMEATEFECKNVHSGCNARMLYKDIRNHEMSCEYRTVSCDIITFHNKSSLVCKEDVVLINFYRHIENCHKSCVVKFEWNAEITGELRQQKTNAITLLKNVADDLNFVQRIFVSEDEIFISYYYIGKNCDAKNYSYTVAIVGKGGSRMIKYSCVCISNYKEVQETMMDDRCLVLERKKIFNSPQARAYYFVKIKDVNS